MQPTAELVLVSTALRYFIHSQTAMACNTENIVTKILLL